MPIRHIRARLAAALVIALGLGVLAAPPAFAADAALTVEKTVDGQNAVTVDPGDEFTYNVAVGCDDADCVDAQLVDVLPPEFAGFTIVSTAVNPPSQPTTTSLAGCTTEVTPSCTITVDFVTALGGATTGIRAGDTHNLLVRLRAPLTLSPSWASNGIAVNNTAVATSTTAPSATDSALVTVVIPVTVDVAVSKTWSPASQQFSPGVQSTVALTARNTSNVAAESVSLQDPKTADDAAAALPASNPFAIVDFVSFGAVTAPQGADRVTVDAYVFDGSSWDWVRGAPTAVAAAALPAGVAPGDVAGLRFAFTDAAGASVIAPGGSAGSVQFTVAQRPTNRSTGASLVLGTTATNQVAATVAVAAKPPVTRDAQAPYRIAGLTVDVSAGKTIAPSRIPAGTSAAATITARNDSNGPLDSLTVRDDDFFTADVAFGGFSAPIAFPAGATGASVVWSFSDDSASAPQTVAAGSTPTAPSAPAGAHLTGFAVTYTGAIAPAASATLRFSISPTVDLVPDSASSPVRLENTATVSGSNAAGSDSASATAPLAVYFPEIDLGITKTVSPTAPVTAGGTVVVQLPTTTGTDSAFVRPTRVVVQDVWRQGESDDFWNAFSPVAVAPTQVVAGSSLLVEYTLNGTTWQTLDSVPATGATVVYSSSIEAPVDSSAIVGLRYTFENPAGLAQGTTVSPNTVFAARATLRDGGASTSVVDAAAAVYENRGFATATGAVLGAGTITSDQVDDLADAQIRSTSGTGTVLADKDWTTASVVSQSGSTATTRLGWAVTAAGAAGVTVSDPAAGKETTPADTVFQAFDLRRIPAVTFAQDPLLRWDRVTAVELFRNGAWVSASPGTNWMGQSGFVGYTLTPAQSADTTGVRLVIAPDDAARQASTNPLRPPVGSGIASSAAGAVRPVTLEWTLRNVARVGGGWIGEDDYPSVSNTVGVVVGGVETTDSDSIALVDFAPAVTVTKSATVAAVTVPEQGDVTATAYPKVGYTVTARNDSASRASYLRVSDPMLCTESTVSTCVTDAGDWAADPYDGAAYDPVTNPFERLDLTSLAFQVPAGQVDKTASLVTLWKRDATGALSRQVLTAAAAESLTAPQLADVVGVSVLYQNPGAETRGGSIASGSNLVMTLGTTLRVHERSDQTKLVAPTTVENHANAQSYDPVLFPSGAGSAPHDSAFDDVTLEAGRLDVVATKAFSPGSLLQKDRAAPVSVRLGASDGTATAPASTVTITDVDEEFWDSFDLTGLGAVALPAGADRVRVSVQLGGASAWVDGPAGATAALPAVSLADVTGIRFVFDRADGGLLSHSAPAADWSASANLAVRLRDATRTAATPVAFPGTIDNRVVAVSSRADGAFASATDDATDVFTLQTGSRQLDVSKSPEGNVHTVYPGTVVPWTLTFTNTGTGYLTVSTLADQLPSHLSFDFENPAFSTSAGGSLSTDVAYSYDEATRGLSFDWPAGGDRMSPGETFTVKLGLTLEPGLSVSDRATNTMTVTTLENLSACTNQSGNGQGVVAGSPATQCATTNFVQPTPGASLATYKGVKGDIASDLVSGAVNTATPGGACVVDAEGYYRSPCAANTAIGSTDEWKLLAVNSGTEGYRSLTLVDPMPRPADRMLATGGARGSAFQPVFDGAAGVRVTGAPAGSTVAWQVSTDAGACVGTGTSTWNADPTCAANGWINGAAYTGDWAAVTALRVTVDFAATAGGVLPPAGSVKVVYTSTNRPASAALPTGAPVDAPVAAQYAWNQFGAHAVLVGGATLQRAPVKVGVRLVESALAVTKAVTGAAAAFAPSTFRADVACTVAGVPLALGGRGSVVLDAGNALTSRLDHLPLGATCTVTEAGAVGEYGESSRSGSPATIELLTPTDTVAPVVAAQNATITNAYDFTTLSIAKRVDTLATVGDFGTFGFALSCTTALGQPVQLAPGDAAFRLAAGETHTVTADTVPVGARCDLDESAPGAADSVAISGDGVVDNGDGTATVTAGATATIATVANTFEAGTLSVLKTVTGAGSGPYGVGPFAASVTCTYGGDVVYSEASLPIVAGVPTLVPAVMPVGTSCAVAEVLTGGATTVDPTAAVTIAGPTGSAPLGSVVADITNHFDLGSLEIVKLRTGDGVAEFGDGPFEATVVCTWVKDGVELTVPLPDGGVYALDEANGYSARVDGIIVGARCAVDETDAGLAATTTMVPADGTVVVAAQAAPVARVEITNVFDVGRLELDKTADATIIAAGATVGYRVTVRNVGQLDATDVAVVDSLPRGAALVSTSPAATVDGQRLDWTLPRLAVGESATFTVTVRYADQGEHVNTATVDRPDGAWRATLVEHACDTDPAAACAAVTVLPPVVAAVAQLALTGGGINLLLLAVGCAAVLAGALVLALRRRRARA